MSILQINFVGELCEYLYGTLPEREQVQYKNFEMNQLTEIQPYNVLTGVIRKRKLSRGGGVYLVFTDESIWSVRPSSGHSSTSGSGFGAFKWTSCFVEVRSYITESISTAKNRIIFSTQEEKKKN